MISAPMPIEPRTLRPEITQPIAVAVIVSRYSNEVTDALERGAVEEFNRRIGVSLTPKDAAKCRLDVIPAPGSFELPALCSAAIETGDYDAIVALGCVVKGETRHDEYIAHAVAQQLARLAMDALIPVGFGLVTTDTWEQALARAGGPMGNKGAEAMDAALEALGAMMTLGSD